MPVVLRVSGYRFWFYEADLNEPPHVHVGKAGKEAVLAPADSISEIAALSGCRALRYRKDYCRV